ncbi:MAG: XRE family transcriptional regulator [Sphingobacteriales bacterium]|nr:MAG: XRE family transcriptional regulator [Sphingobacteriales bacterium]
MGSNSSMYGDKIRAFRIMRGFSQEYMADKLSIAQNTYSKYENNAEKLPFETLEKIADVLGVSVVDITSNEPIIINNQSSNQGAQGKIEHFYTDQKELFEKVIASKDEEIKSLMEVITSLKEVIVSLTKKG